MIATEKPKFDMPLFLCCLLLLGIGLVTIYSATRNAENEALRALFGAQIRWMVIGLAILGIVSVLPARVYYGLAYLLYGLAVLMLLYLEFAGGHVSKGAERWIAMGPIKLQPSEFLKIGLILAFAKYLSAKTISLTRPSSLVIPGLLLLIPFAMVLKQPDLGTALILGGVVLPMLFWAGMPVFEIFIVVSPILSMLLSFHWLPWGLYFLALFVVLYFSRPSFGILSLTILINIATAAVTAIIWNFLHDYQKNRILSFLDPGRDPFGAGYQIIQSKVAVGSGRFVGKGFLQGSQTKLSFLPEQHTDFVFSVFGEQFGFVGAALVLLVFFFLVVRCLYIAREARNRFVGLLCVGIASAFGLHIYTNLAMTVGMMPVTGIPLPFLSYGGSFMITCMILAGLAISGRRSSADL